MKRLRRAAVQVFKCALAELSLLWRLYPRDVTAQTRLHFKECPNDNVFTVLTFRCETLWRSVMVLFESSDIFSMKSAYEIPVTSYSHGLIVDKRTADKCSFNRKENSNVHLWWHQLKKLIKKCRTYCIVYILMDSCIVHILMELLISQIFPVKTFWHE